eukprot:gene20826-1130_t
MFAKIDEEQKELGNKIDHRVSIQVIELYMEQVNDLLLPKKKWPAKGFKPRMLKNGYVVETKTVECFNYEDIKAQMRRAGMNRTTGSHNLNDDSSRAHTIYTINYERIDKSDKE